MRKLKIGDRVVNWNGESGTVLTVTGDNFRLRYDSTREVEYQWFEFTPADIDEYWGSFRFEDTEYPEWPL